MLKCNIQDGDVEHLSILSFNIFFRDIRKMGKDPTKPRGKMSSYAYFVQTCREEHKKKHPDTSVNFSEFSKKCSERWKVYCILV